MDSVAKAGMHRGMWRISNLVSALRRGRAVDHAVGALPDRLLADIGVTRQDYRGASGKMYWDAPDHWFDDPSRR